jgi:Transglutaminase-like superfamily
MTSTVRNSWRRGAERVQPLGRLNKPRDLRLLMRILVFAIAVPVRTRAKPASWDQFAGGERRGAEPVSADAVEQTAHYVDAVLVTFSPLVRPGCLVRGLTMYHFLREAGVDVSLSFGVGRLGEDFTGHCWLVKDGAPFLETGQPDRDYIETFRLPTVEWEALEA